MGSAYQEFHRRSIEEPGAFWSEQASLIDWHRPFEQVLDYFNPPFAKWFVGGETNLCYNAVDRHLPERADQPALIYISSETNREKTYPGDLTSLDDPMGIEQIERAVLVPVK